MELKSKLIIVEGLPGSGKSTIAQFIAHQLQANHVKAQWYYEVGLYHPLEFCSVACIDKYKNEEILNKYSDFRTILENEMEEKYGMYFYKYIELERRYKEILPKELLGELESYDVENSNVDTYMELKAQMWREYSSNIKISEEITIIESCLLQGPIVTMLLSNKPKEEIKRYINNLLAFVKESNPTLIYLYQEDVEKAIKKIFDFRGADFTDYIINMVCESDYGKSRGLSGIEGALEFFKEYRSIGDELFTEFNIAKIPIENSKGIWDSYRREIIKSLSLNFYDKKVLPVTTLEKYVGSYYNREIQREIHIKLEDERLFFYTNLTYKEELIPIHNNSFHIEASTLDVVFISDEIGNVTKFVISGKDTAASYGNIGMVFGRI